VVPADIVQRGQSQRKGTARDLEVLMKTKAKAKAKAKADRIKREKPMDESFRGMGEDADYRKEALLILEEFAESDAETLAPED
jgi:hypothetical protein